MYTHAVCAGFRSLAWTYAEADLPCRESPRAISPAISPSAILASLHMTTQENDEEYGLNRSGSGLKGMFDVDVMLKPDICTTPAIVQ